MECGYQFGETDLAAERLAEVARVFRDSSASFLSRITDRSFPLAGDLGCGPGFTTRLLADLLAADKTVGYDTSSRFLELARRHDTPGIEYFQHDVRATPFPAGPVDLLYCRFLLSHLPDVPAVLEVWASQLEPRGLLLLDEVEAIHSSNRWFGKYLRIVEGMLEDSGSRLYVGPILEPALPHERLGLVRSHVHRMDVSNGDAAAMFSRNMPNWRTNAYVQANFSASEIDELLAALFRETSSPESRSEITWELRQMIFERS